MKTTYMSIVAVFATALCFLTASSQTIRQTKLRLDDNTGIFLNLVSANLGGVGKTITFPNNTGVVALTTDITGAVQAGSFTSLNANGGGIANAGSISGGTGIMSSGTITLSGLGGGGKLLVQASNTGVLSASNTLAAALNLGSNQINNLGDPTSGSDAATKSYVDNVVAAPAEAVILDPATSARNVVKPTLASAVPLTIEGAASQSVDLQDWSSSTPSVLASVDKSGNIKTTAAVTAEQATFSPANTDVGLTINNSGTGFDITGSSSWDVDHTGGAYFQTLSLANPLAVNQGGTHTTSLAGYGVLEMNSNGSTITSNLLTDGQIIVGVTGSQPLSTTLSGDVSMNNSGYVTVNTYNGGTAFGTMANQNANNVNITGGTIGASVILTGAVFAKINSSQPTAPTISTNDPTNITGLTLSSHATDAAGIITFTTNGNEVIGDYVQLTFNYSTTQPIVLIGAANDAAGSTAIPIGVYTVATGGPALTGNFQIVLGSNWGGYPNTYSFYYHVIDNH